MCISLAFLDRSRSYQTCHQTHKSHAAQPAQFNYSRLTQRLQGDISISISIRQSCVIIVIRCILISRLPHIILNSLLTSSRPVACLASYLTHYSHHLFTSSRLPHVILNSLLTSSRLSYLSLSSS